MAASTSERTSFEHEWVCVGRVEDVAQAGTWLRAPLTRAGVLVVRQPDGSLRGMHAVCTHRGAAFIERDEGCAARFMCPYHRFEFEIDGRACADTPDLMLVRVDTLLGFVFVTLNADAPPLAEALGEIPPWLERADLSRLSRARRVAYDVEARWPVVVENFQESLHFPSVHPALEALTPSSRAETWMPSPDAHDASLWLGGIMPIVDTAETVSLSGKRNDRPYLVHDEDRRLVHDAICFPNLLTSLQPDYLLTFTLFPVSAGVTRVIASTYVHEDAPASSLDDVFTFWSRVYDEDKLVCERQERGLSSRPVSPAYTNVEEGAAAFTQLLTLRTPRTSASTPAPAPAPAPAPRSRLCGIFGRPYADLSPLIDTSQFDDLHREITRGLALVETSYTGGSLKWMGVCAPWIQGDGYRDAMHAIESMSPAERAELIALGDYDDPSSLDPADSSLTFGDETDRPFTKAQMLFLEQRHGVYFPWKVCYHLLENDRWEDKHSGANKDFSGEAREIFPKTVAFIESLPMIEMGRVVLFGLLANDHAPLHRDSEPGKALAIAQSITFAPCRDARRKRFYLASPDGSHEVEVDTPVYWFNDMDWHGVHDDPFFRYSIRCDGVFEPEFLERVRVSSGRAPRSRS